MVYATQRFRVVPNPLDTPISIGDTELPPDSTAPTLPTPGYGYGYPYGPVQFPIPSTESTPGVGDVPAPTTCPTGQAPNAAGQCVPIQEFPPCATGYARNTTTGLCEPIPFPSGQGDISNVQVPASVTVGNSFKVTTWFVNTTTGTLQYVIRITIPSIGVDYTAPALSVSAGQTANVETTLVIPANTPPGTYTGTVELKAYSLANIQVHQDSEQFTLVVTTAGGSTPTASITLSATSVKQGSSISVNAAGFGAGEVIGFWATPINNPNLAIAGDNKNAGSNGAVKLDTLTFSSTAPLGQAKVYAHGRITNKEATATVNVIAKTTTTTPPPTTTTCPRISGDISITLRRISSRYYEIRWSSSGFRQGETLSLKYYKYVANGPDVLFATHSDTVAGSTDGDNIKVPSTISCVRVRIAGSKSGKIAYANFKPT